MNRDFDAIMQMSDSFLISSCFKLLSVSCFMTMPFRTILVMCCRSSNAEVINLLCMKKCMSSCLLHFLVSQELRYGLITSASHSLQVSRWKW